MLLFLKRTSAVVRSLYFDLGFLSSKHLSLDSSVSVNMDVEALLEKLTVEEKVALTAGE